MSIRLRILVHTVNHDGYCSDNESGDTGDTLIVGRTVYIDNETLQFIYDSHFVNSCNRFNKKGLKYLEETYNKENLMCEVGSGYCDYRGYERVVSGVLIEN